VDNDLDIILANLKNCLEKKEKISSLQSIPIINTMNNNNNKINNIDELIEIEEAISIEKQDFSKYFNQIKLILNDFNLDENSLIKSKINVNLIAQFSMDKQAFLKQINHLIENLTDLDLSPKQQMNLNNRFNYFAKILIKNQNYLFESDINLFKEFDLDQEFLNNLDLLNKCTRIILTYLVKFDYKKYLNSNDDDLQQRNEISQFLIKAFNYKPVLFKLLIKLAVDKNGQNLKNLNKFSSTNETLKQVIEQCLNKDNEIDQKSEQELTQTELNFISFHSISDKLKQEMNSFSIDKLLEMYTFSLSHKDQAILKRLFELDSDLNCLIFKSNKLTDFIALKLNQDPLMIKQTIQNYPITRGTNDLNNYLEKKICLDSLILDEYGLIMDSKIFDPIYVLPNIYHLLDYGMNLIYIYFKNAIAFIFVLF